MDAEPLTIGRVAHLADVSVETVRYNPCRSLITAAEYVRLLRSRRDGRVSDRPYRDAIEKEGRG